MIDLKLYQTLVYSFLKYIFIFHWNNWRFDLKLKSPDIEHHKILQLVFIKSLNTFSHVQCFFSIFYRFYEKVWWKLHEQRAHGYSPVEQTQVTSDFELSMV